MEREDQPFFREHRQRRQWNSAVTVAIIVAVSAALAVLLVVSTRENVDLYTAIMVVVATGFVFLAVVATVYGIRAERERRRRILGGGVDPDAFYAPNVASVCLQGGRGGKGEKGEGEKFLTHNRLYTISMPDRESP